MGKILSLMYKMIFAGLARAEEHSDGDDPAHALPRPLGALHRDGQGRSGGCKEQQFLSCTFYWHINRYLTNLLTSAIVLKEYRFLYVCQHLHRI